jgi:hypothetical protein
LSRNLKSLRGTKEATGAGFKLAGLKNGFYVVCTFGIVALGKALRIRHCPATVMRNDAVVGSRYAAVGFGVEYSRFYFE